MTERRLYISRRFSGYAIVTDEHHPTMWRVRHPDGELSDMVNLTRAKDAALAMATRRPGGGPPQAPAVEWK